MDTVNADSDTALRSDLRRLGTLLGQTLCRQEGQHLLLDLVEEVRGLVRTDADAAAQRLACFDVSTGTRLAPRLLDLLPRRRPRHLGGAVQPRAAGRDSGAAGAGVVPTGHRRGPGQPPACPVGRRCGVRLGVRHRGVQADRGMRGAAGAARRGSRGVRPAGPLPARSRAGCWSRSAGCPRRSGWTAGRATYVGLNIVGSDNNFPVFDSAGRQIDGDAAEALPRDAANQQWLRDTFTLARQRRSVAVLVVIQADMDWYGQFKAAGNPTDGFDATKKTLLQQTIAFPGQVALPPSSWTSR